MDKRSFSAYYLLIILVTVSCVQVNAESILSWFWNKKEDSAPLIADGVPLISIPYEMLTEDEKFLKEASKLVTDIQISSPLEICQHKVVLKIKTSCSSMSEEDLAKLSVNLLNCQSMTEGRKVFPCSDEMTIKQCTMNMDPDTWNAYHLMSNRARAVCYAARSHQFRALTELTVNKLMQSAHSQIQTLSSMKESQDRLEEQTMNANKLIKSNIQELADEKALIRAGHEQLANMTEDIKQKLEKASQDLLEQAEVRGENHEELLSDLENLKIQTQLLWEKIESSTNRIIDQNHEASLRYEETLMKLERINETICFIFDLTNRMRAELDQKLSWISEYIGTTEEHLKKAYRITLHIIYLLAAMLVAAFLQAPILTRSAILGMVPLNLMAFLKHGYNACLDFASLSVLILLITAMHYVMNGIQYLIRSRDKNNKGNEKHQEASFINGKALFNGNTVLNGNGNLNDQFEPQKQKPSLIQIFLHKMSSLLDNINRQIAQSIAKLKAVYESIKSWIWQKSVPTEELSCSYIPARKGDYVTSRGYPSMSEDESDYTDSREFGRDVVSDYDSPTGAVLRNRADAGKSIDPLTAFFKGIREPTIRETMLIPRPRKPSSRSVTPVSRAPCGAKTRSGNPCRLMASKGQNYCHKHVSDSSPLGN